jgi:hypothetical protein
VPRCVQGTDEQYRALHPYFSLGLLVTDTKAGRRMALRMGPTTWGRCGSGTGGALIWSGQDGVKSRGVGLERLAGRGEQWTQSGQCGGRCPCKRQLDLRLGEVSSVVGELGRGESI